MKTPEMDDCTRATDNITPKTSWPVDIVEKIRSEWGKEWAEVPREYREAFIDREIVEMILQASPTASFRQVQAHAKAVRRMVREQLGV